MNLRNRLENNLVVFFFSTLLTGFLAGIATYEGILRIAQIHRMTEAQYLEYQELKQGSNTQKKEQRILLVAGNKTIIRDFNIAVKLGGMNNYDPKNRSVLLHFYYPKNPSDRITEENMNDEINSVSWVAYSLESDLEKRISLGEVGVFSVSVREIKFNEKHDLVQSLEFVIKS